MATVFNRSFALGDSTNQENRSRYKAMNSAFKLNPAWLHESYILGKAANLIFSEKSSFYTAIHLLKMFVIHCIQACGTAALRKEAEELVIFMQVSQQTQF